jgi:hypothetical protein
MSTLVLLLNARHMLRSLLSGNYWPQSGLGAATKGVGADFHAAVEEAYRQWESERGEPFPISRGELDNKLRKQFDAEHSRRDTYRKSLNVKLRQGLSAISDLAGAASVIGYLSMLEEMERVDRVDDEGSGGPVALVARALLDQTAGMAPEVSATELAQEFLALVDATLDQDQQGASRNEIDLAADAAEARASETALRWVTFRERLTEESSAQMGGFARLMFGDTSAGSRRRIQQSFNRPQAYPMVVVAQSRVGREGLNLHQACSVVLLMHPEWNPAVVEQQIGRIDRVNSLWSKRLVQAVKSGARGAQLPRIEVLPVIFRGTYDEYQWSVLNERWADLRAQLHGEVISPASRPACPSPDERKAMEFLQSVAPIFSPVSDRKAEALPSAVAAATDQFEQPLSHR